MTGTKLLLELNGGLLFLSGTGAGGQLPSRLEQWEMKKTYLVKQVRAAFWKSAEVQTQVVSVLNKSALRPRFAILTHMLEHPAELAAWVTHCKTQAEMLGVLYSQQKWSGWSVRSMQTY